MKNNYFSSKIILFLLFTTISLFSQTKESDKEKISKYFEEYFFLERENIHIQPDKTTFLSDEEIWLKGYVYHRKEKLPFFTTTNVYVNLHDENGNKISEKLFYANNGSFSGKFKLGNSFKTGKYYIHAYTNWMNNFKEDESTIIEINIIDRTDKSISQKKISDLSQINIEFNPEGGAIIANSINTIGIKITDCIGNPISVSEADILNSKNEIIQNIKINKLGLSKFSINTSMYPLKIAVTTNGKTIVKDLPDISPDFIALEINNFSFNDKTIAKIRTNKSNIDELKKNNLYFVIQQDNKTSIFDINFTNNNTEQTLVFSNENLFEGLNTIRIIDSNMKQHAERYVFKHHKQSLAFDYYTTEKNNNSTTFSGKLNFPNNSISISVLPENSISINENASIFSSFLIEPYLTKNSSSTTTRDLFNDVTKQKHYELDLFLLNQSSGKYRWSDIVSQVPKKSNDFDFGLTLKGTINQEIKDKKKYKIHLYSYSSRIDETTEINDKNEFFFNNLILSDSTWVNLSLVDEKNKSSVLKLYPQIINGRRNFKNPFFLQKNNCNTIAEKIEYDIPDLALGTIALDDVEISVSQKKTKLKHQNALGNGNLRGYKISEDTNNSYMDVLHFIRNNGFDVPINSQSASVQIFTRVRTSTNGSGTPVLFIDGVQQMNFDLLFGMKMNEIDEIYINPHAIGLSSKNNFGIIKIFRKVGVSSPTFKSDSTPFEIKKAFSKVEKFKNALYVSSDSKGFQNFGIINWIPTIMTQDTGEFNFEIPNMNQKRVKLLIEGFSAEGNLISEIRTIDLP